MANKTNLEMKNTRDMYHWYLAKMLKDPHTAYFTEYDSVIRQKGIFFLMKMVDGKPIMHMTYTWFRAILERNNMKAREAVINSKRYNLGSGLGCLEARRVERNFSNPKINVIATVRYRNANPGSQNRIYYTDDDYCRIGWVKMGVVIPNMSVYEFKPCKAFRLNFSTANTSNPVLKMKYTYFPLTDKSHGN